MTRHLTREQIEMMPFEALNQEERILRILSVGQSMDIDTLCKKIRSTNTRSISVYVSNLRRKGFDIVRKKKTIIRCS